MKSKSFLSPMLWFNSTVFNCINTHNGENYNLILNGTLQEKKNMLKHFKYSLKKIDIIDSTDSISNCYSHDSFYICHASIIKKKSFLLKIYKKKSSFFGHIGNRTCWHVLPKLEIWTLGKSARQDYLIYLGPYFTRNRPCIIYYLKNKI